MSQRILFVCLGNICRSPLAQGIAEKLAQDLRLTLEFDSAATGSWHIGKNPDARAIVAARTRGYNIKDQVARVVRNQDFFEFDLIIAMDRDNLNDLRGLKPQSAPATLHLMSDFALDQMQEDIPDPYYSGKFLPVIDQIEIAIAGLLRQFRAVAQ